MYVFWGLSSLSQYHITAFLPDTTFNGIPGKIVLHHGKVILSLSLSLQELDIYDNFYIVSNVSFNADLLIGFHTMCKYNISPFPAMNEIAR